MIRTTSMTRVCTDKLPLHFNEHFAENDRTQNRALRDTICKKSLYIGSANWYDSVELCIVSYHIGHPVLYWYLQILPLQNSCWLRTRNSSTHHEFFIVTAILLNDLEFIIVLTQVTSGSYIETETNWLCVLMCLVFGSVLSSSQKVIEGDVLILLN